MATLTLSGIEKKFDGLQVVRPTDLRVEQGEFLVIVGPSGCGKSTLLRMIAGLEAVSAGSIHIEGRDVTNLPPVERNVAMVFQNYALYPHMTVEENIGFGLMIAGMRRQERQSKVLEAARILRLEPYLHRRPKALSGGQRQRVAIGRAIVKQPQLFLFDEPLSNLDAELRHQTRLEIAKLHQDLRATIIYVTHDQVEAMTLADRIVVLRDGGIEQTGTPMHLYLNPDNLFVAGFIGSPKMNFIDGRIVETDDQRGDAALVSMPGVCAKPFEIRGLRAHCQPGQHVTVGVRPEHIVDGGGSVGFTATVRLIEHLGSVSYAYVETVHGGRLTVQRSVSAEGRIGSILQFAFAPTGSFLFSASGERL
jgi:ABC-type sugar transport system ATPase subunit